MAQPVCGAASVRCSQKTKDVPPPINELNLVASTFLAARNGCIVFFLSQDAISSSMSTTLFLTIDTNCSRLVIFSNNSVKASQCSESCGATSVTTVAVSACIQQRAVAGAGAVVVCSTAHRCRESQCVNQQASSTVCCRWALGRVRVC